MPSLFLTGAVTYTDPTIDKTNNSFTELIITCTLTVPNGKTIEQEFSIDGTFDEKSGLCECQIVFSNVHDTLSSVNLYSGTINFTIRTDTFDSVDGIFAKATVTVDNGNSKTTYGKVTDLDVSDAQSSNTTFVQHGTAARKFTVPEFPFTLYYDNGSEWPDIFTCGDANELPKFMDRSVTGSNFVDYVAAPVLEAPVGNSYIFAATLTRTGGGETTLIDCKYGVSDTSAIEDLDFDSTTVRFGSSTVVTKTYTLSFTTITLSATVDFTEGTLSSTSYASSNSDVENVGGTLSGTSITSVTEGNTKTWTINVGNLDYKFRPKIVSSSLLRTYSAGMHFGIAGTSGEYGLNLDETCGLHLNVGSEMTAEYTDSLTTYFPSPSAPNDVSVASIAAAHMTSDTSAAAPIVPDSFYGVLAGEIVIYNDAIFTFAFTGKAVANFTDSLMARSVLETADYKIQAGRELMAPVVERAPLDLSDLYKIGGPVKAPSMTDKKIKGKVDFLAATQATKMAETFMNKFVEIGAKVINKSNKKIISDFNGIRADHRSKIVEINAALNDESPDPDEILSLVDEALSDSQNVQKSIDAMRGLGLNVPDELPTPPARPTAFLGAMTGSFKTLGAAVGNFFSLMSNYTGCASVLNNLPGEFSAVEDDFVALEKLKDLFTSDSAPVPLPNNIEINMWVSAKYDGTSYDGKLSGIFSKNNDDKYVPTEGCTLKFDSLDVPALTDLFTMVNGPIAEVTISMFQTEEISPVTEITVKITAPVIIVDPEFPQA